MDQEQNFPEFILTVDSLSAEELLSSITPTPYSDSIFVFDEPISGSEENVFDQLISAAEKNFFDQSGSVPEEVVIVDHENDQFVYATQDTIDPMAGGITIVPDNSDNPYGYMTQGFYNVALNALDKIGLSTYFHFDEDMNLQLNDQNGDTWKDAGSPFKDIVTMDLFDLISLAGGAETLSTHYVV